MLNTMEYTYDYPRQVLFKSVEGDVMKRLEGICTLNLKRNSVHVKPKLNAVHVREPTASAQKKKELNSQYTYECPRLVRFKSVEVDVMKRLEGIITPITPQRQL